MVRKKRAVRVNSKRKSGQSHPHDAIFQKIYKHKEFVKEIVAISFTESELAVLDLASARIKESEARNVAGKSRRPDLVISVNLKESAGEPPVTICVVFEFKAHRAHDVVLQIKEYHTELCRRTGGIVIPIVLLCCEDESFDPPSDYNSWVFRARGGKIPASVQALSHLNPNFFCKIINFHKLPDSVLCRAKSTAVVIEAIRRFWKADEEDIALLLEKAREIPPEHKGIVMIPLTDYYKHTDKGYDRDAFDLIERQRWPDMEEKERLMPTLEFSLDLAEKRGIEQGMRQERVAVARNLLRRGVNEKTICESAQLSAEELAAIKRELKN